MKPKIIIIIILYLSIESIPYVPLAFKLYTIPVENKPQKRALAKTAGFRADVDICLTSATSSIFGDQ